MTMYDTINLHECAYCHASEVVVGMHRAYRGVSGLSYQPDLIALCEDCLDLLDTYDKGSYTMSLDEAQLIAIKERL